MSTLPADRPSWTDLKQQTDGQLLELFVDRGDREALGVLVGRHGPTVLGVCRRVLQHDQDSEDAFQATFVVLARKAKTISKHDSVASWLYKVAHRVGLRQRLNKSRRQSQEHQLRERYAAHRSEDSLHGVVQREVKQILDEEIQRLPEKYRAPILLCYLQGQTNEAAATLLCCPTGTVKIRLLRGREMLRKRLVKRGVALSIAALVGELLTQLASAAVPEALSRAARQAAAGMTTPTVTRLASAVLKGMCQAKLKLAAVVMLTLALTCLTNGLLNRAAGATHREITPGLQTPESPPTSKPTILLAQLPKN
jgi:RNA polymerase sigma factor (sigma-70 family)